MSEWSALIGLIRWYFANYHELNPLYAKIQIASYEPYDPENLTAVKVKMKEVSRELPFRYKLEVNTRPVFVGRKHDSPDVAPDEKLDLDFEVDDTWEWKQGDEFERVHLMNWERIADAVEDDAKELARSTFPYWLQLGAMTRDTRRELYARDLGDIDERPKGVDAAHGKSFLRALAAGATYDKDGHYWQKWKPGRVGKYPYEDNATERFFRENWRELELVKDQLYVAISGVRGLLIYNLVYDKEKKTAQRVVFSGIPDDTYQDPKFLEKRGKVPYTVYLIAANNGVAKRKPPTYRKSYDIDRDATHEIADPRAMVEASIGHEAAALLGLSDPFDWFVEMVSLRFPNRFYFVNLRGYHNTWTLWGALDLSGSRERVHPYVQKAMSNDPYDEYGGVFTSEARKQVEAALKDPNMLVIPQGLALGGNTRFIGRDDAYAYFFQIETQYVEVMPMADFLSALTAQDFADELYASTKWIIPMATVAVYTAAIFVGAGVAAELGVTASAVRTWAVNYARRTVTNEVLWGAVKRFGPALAAVLTDLVLALWDDPKSKTDAAGRWRHFARGFFHGYVVQTLYDNLYKKVETLVEKGPKEYRMAVAIKKVYHTLDNVQQVYYRLSAELDPKGAKNARAKLEASLQHLVHGVGLLISAAYYVEHGDAAAMLDIFGRAGEEPPDAAEWEAEATEQIKAISQQVNDAIAKADDFDALFVAIKDSKLLKAGLALAVLRGQIFSVIKYTWSKKKGSKKPIKSRRKYAFYAAAISAVLLLADDQGGDNVKAAEAAVANALEKIVALLSDTLSNFPGRSEDEAELHGKIVGNLLGGFVLDRFLFKDDHKFRKVFDAPIIAPTMKNNLKHGVVKGFLALIFKRYLSLYNDLVKHGVLSKERRDAELSALVNEARDRSLDARGLGHLKHFEDDSPKAMSIHDLFKAVVAFHDVMAQDGAEILQQHYAGDIARVKEDILATAKLGDELGISGFAEEHAKALFLVMHTHVKLALDHLVEALRNLFEPFMEGGHFSWMSVLKELGFDVGDVAKVQAEVTQMYKDQLGIFRK